MTEDRKPLPTAPPETWEPQPIDAQKKVAIVGFASSSRDLAPWNDTSYEIWTLNHAYQWARRWDRWFEIHPKDHVEKNLIRDGQAHDGNEHLKWLQTRTADVTDGAYGPIYMQEHFPDIPASTRFPREEINAWFARNGLDVALTEGWYAEDYYTSSISQMLALAFYLGFGEIHLYGIDLLQDEEYFYQRAGAEYLIGWGRGRGHRIYIPRPSALCKANYTYGYSWPPSDLGNMEPLIKFTEDKQSGSEEAMKRVARDAHVFDGALQMLRVLEEWIKAGADIPAEIVKKRADLEKRKLDMEHGLRQVAGQAEAFKSMAIWMKHWARGGKLDI